MKCSAANSTITRSLLCEGCEYLGVGFILWFRRLCSWEYLGVKLSKYENQFVPFLIILNGRTIIIFKMFNWFSCA